MFPARILTRRLVLSVLVAFMALPGFAAEEQKDEKPRVWTTADGSKKLTGVLEEKGEDWVKIKVRGSLYKLQLDLLSQADRDYVKTHKNPPNRPPPSETSRETVGTGTGFSITSSGHIVTNAHVIGNATSISVYVDGVKTRATVLAIDKKNDLAILKINKSTQALHIETAEAPGLGDAVTAVGFPNPSIQGRAMKVTKGALSALKGIQDDIRHFQIDAAVQPGNSGGPLLSGSGSVIGIVNARLDAAAVLKATGSLPQNVNYAIKVDYLLPLVKTVKGLSKLIESVDVTRGKSLGDLVEGSVFLIESTVKK